MSSRLANGSLACIIGFMNQSIVHVALVVREYDEAIDFYTKKLSFTLVEDTYQPAQDKRWVLVAPPGSSGTALLLARASKPEQESFIGNQAGGRVFLFLSTDDFWRDYNRMLSLGINSSASQRLSRTAPLQYSKTYMEISGALQWAAS